MLVAATKGDNNVDIPHMYRSVISEGLRSSLTDVPFNEGDAAEFTRLSVSIAVMCKMCSLQITQ